MSLSHPWRRRLLFLVTLYFTFLGGTFVTDHRLWPRVMHHVVVTLCLLAWALARWRAPRTLPRTALDAPLLAYLAANALATVFAVDPRLSLEFLWRLGVHVTLYYVIAGWLQRGHGRDVLEALFFFSGVVVLVGLFEFASWYFGFSAVIPIFRQGWPEIGGWADPIPPRIHRLNSTLGFSTGLSAYFAALIPFGLAFALTGRQSDTRRAFWLWLVGALVIEGLSFSRGGLLSLAVSLPTFAFLALWGNPERRARVGRLASDRRLLAVGAVLLILVVVFGLGWARQSLSGHRSGDAVRLDLWRSALAIFREHPLTGVGPYGYGRALRDVRNALITGDRHLTADNRLLTTLAETGLPGIAALLWLGGRFVWIGYHRCRAAQGAAQLRLAAAFAGVVGFGIHNVVDTFTATPILLPMLVMAAFVAHDPVVERSEAREEHPAPRLRVSWVLLVVLVALSGLGWFVSDRAVFHFERSLRLEGQGDLDGALAAIEQAQAIDPAFGLYAFQRAYLLGQMAAEDPASLDAAIDAYEAALMREGTYDLHRANLAALYAQAGRLDDARAEMALAGEISPKTAEYTFWQGAYAEMAGDQEEAAVWYGEALQLKPEWAVSQYWSGTAWRADFRASLPDELVHEVGMPPNPTSAPGYAFRAEARLAAGDPEGAERLARTALFLDPLGEGRRGNYVLGQLAEAAGDLEAAEEHYLAAGPAMVVAQNWDVSVYGRLANFQYLPQLEAPGPASVVFEPWFALIELYQSQGRAADVETVYDAIRAHDPFFGE
jgi:tetratricopeptide (TPR) repeat protein